jgi:putative transposase
MPRTPRLLLDGYAYHVLNRGNDRRVIFKKSEDYQAFFRILAEAQQHVAMPIAALCVMPNHWHLVLWPQHACAIPAYMHWMTNAHVHRYNQHYKRRGQGHLYQDRYKCFPIQDTRHLYTVLRYVEANPLRGGLVERVEEWQWSSMWLRNQPDGEGEGIMGSPCLELPPNWCDIVNDALPEPLLEALQHSARREVPFGDDAWVTKIVEEGGEKKGQAP